nr:MAG TPA: hypothetical protein [Caudoviricetes sp.]
MTETGKFAEGRGEYPGTHTGAPSPSSADLPP